MNDSIRSSKKLNPERRQQTLLNEVLEQLRSRRVTSLKRPNSSERNSDSNRNTRRKYSSRDYLRYHHRGSYEDPIGINPLDLGSYSSHREPFKSPEFMETPMSGGFLTFIKEMIDNRITLLVRSEVKK